MAALQLVSMITTLLNGNNLQDFLEVPKTNILTKTLVEKVTELCVSICVVSYILRFYCSPDLVPWLGEHSPLPPRSNATFSDLPCGLLQPEIPCQHPHEQ